ncbi:MAG: histidinol-phosphate transaminase [Pseudomonadota bacterium]
MSRITDLARPEIRALHAYVPARYRDGLVRLNANEAPWQSAADHTQRGLNQYPEARPSVLTQTLAQHYGVAAEQLFVTRGTSEAIDLLIRCFCRPGIDEVVICPPTFGMYEVYADIQNAAVRRISLLESAEFALPVDQILSYWHGTARLVFVTTPNNPTGHSLASADIIRLVEGLQERGIVVIDAAYIEFADPSAIMALLRYDNVVILRTLSKAYGLAGARCGSLIASPAVVELASKVMPPYAVPTPSTECALAALAEESFQVMPERIRALCAARAELHAALEQLPFVRRVWPSDANFLLVEFSAPQQVMQAAEQAGLLLRDFSHQPATKGSLRITIGTEQQNAALLATLETLARRSDGDTGSTTSQ